MQLGMMKFQHYGGLEIPSNMRIPEKATYIGTVKKGREEK